MQTTYLPYAAQLQIKAIMKLYRKAAAHRRAGRDTTKLEESILEQLDALEESAPDSAVILERQMTAFDKLQHARGFA